MKNVEIPSIIRSAFGQCAAIGSVTVDSIVASLVYGVERMTTQKRPLYSAEFGDIERIASRTGKGWCINGDLFLKSIEATNRHLAVFGNTGSGKTSGIIIPEILQASAQNFVVHDPSGTVLNATAPYLKKKGYKVYVIDFNDPDHSDALNLVDFVGSSSDAGKLMTHFVRSNLGTRSADKFWEISAISLCRQLLQIALKHPPQYRTLKCVQQLLFAFAAEKGSLFPLAAKYMDDQEFAEFKALVKSNEKTLQSVIMTCQACLELFNSEAVCRLTSTTTIDFDRKVPSAIFIKNATWDAPFYRPLLSAMIESIIKLYMTSLPSKGDRQVRFILDECSTLRLNSLENVLANSRKNALAFSCYFQHQGQLFDHMGTEAGNALLSNCYSKLYITSDLNTSRQLQELLGMRTVADTKGNLRTEPLLPAQCIRQMANDEAIFIHGEHSPFKVKMKPYYKQPFLRMRAATQVYKPEPNNLPKTVPLIPLK